MTTRKLQAYLDEHDARYVSIQHSPAFTAAEIASSAHVAGRDFAKTIIVYVDEAPVMLVLPATRRLLLPDLRGMLQTEDLRLATEAELRRLFPDCEVGAMPPFGNLYGMPVYVVPSIACEKQIAFNAGTHTDVVTMDFAEFERLAQPQVIEFVTT